MKRILALLLLAPFISIAQQTAPTIYSFNIVSDLQNQKGTQGATATVNGRTAMNDGSGGTYIWNEASTATADGFSIIQVSGVSTGRWMRSMNSNYASGSVTLSGAALQSTYVVTHNLGYVPGKVFVQATTANAAVISWVHSKTTTTFSITFASVPIIGTNNIGIDWLAVR